MGSVLKRVNQLGISKKDSFYWLAKGLDNNSTKDYWFYCIKIGDYWIALTQKSSHDFFNFRKHNKGLSNFFKRSYNLAFDIPIIWYFVLEINKICDGLKIDRDKEQIHIVFTKSK
jgi:hypothetical protein